MNAEFENVVLGISGDEEKAGEAGRKYMITGVILLILGFFAIVFPLVAGVAVNYIIGVILVLAGVTHLSALKAMGVKNDNWRLIRAILYIGIGTLIFIFPLVGLLTISLLLAIFFLIEGGIKLVSALAMRPLQNWGWMMASGVLALLLALIILAALPEGAAWVVGLFVGINLLLSGWSKIMLSNSLTA